MATDADSGADTDVPVECPYCGSDASAHRDVLVTETGGEPLGRFCGYACLVQYVEAEDLVYGEACDCSL